MFNEGKKLFNAMNMLSALSKDPLELLKSEIENITGIKDIDEKIEALKNLLKMIKMYKETTEKGTDIFSKLEEMENETNLSIEELMKKL